MDVLEYELTPRERMETAAALSRIWLDNLNLTAPERANRAAWIEILIFHSEDRDELVILADALLPMFNATETTVQEPGRCIALDHLADIAGGHARARIVAGLIGYTEGVCPHLGLRYWFDDPELPEHAEILLHVRWNRESRTLIELH